MGQTEVLEWLYQNGGPAIRQRVCADLGYPGRVHTLSNLLNSPLVMTWLERLRGDFGFNQLHGATPEAFENVMGKLTQLGLRAGIQPFDLRLRPYLDWFRQQADQAALSEFSWRPFLSMLAAPFLMRAGYFEERALIEYAAQRLETLYQFCRQGRYDIYVDPADFKGIPKAFRGRPLVDPELTPGGEYRFPTIYDMHLLANLPDRLVGENGQQKIDTIVDYVLHSDYQALPEGYGIMVGGLRKYYAVGWSVHLPGYSGEPEAPFMQRAYLHRLVLMSHFRPARNHRWLREGVAFFDQFRTDEGRYRIPRQYLAEERNGCWVFGSYMGLEENRRTKIALELESTFWMLKFIK